MEERRGEVRQGRKATAVIGIVADGGEMLIVGVGCRGDALVWNFPTRGVRRSGRSAARQVVHYGAGSGKVLGKGKESTQCSSTKREEGCRSSGVNGNKIKIKQKTSCSLLFDSGAWLLGSSRVSIRLYLAWAITSLGQGSRWWLVGFGEAVEAGLERRQRAVSFWGSGGWWMGEEAMMRAAGRDATKRPVLGEGVRERMWSA